METLASGLVGVVAGVGVGVAGKELVGVVVTEWVAGPVPASGFVPARTAAMSTFLVVSRVIAVGPVRLHLGLHEIMSSCFNLLWVTRLGIAGKPLQVGAGNQTIGPEIAEQSKGLFSPGDWQCAKCGNVNWYAVLNFRLVAAVTQQCIAS